MTPLSPRTLAFRFGLVALFAVSCSSPTRSVPVSTSVTVEPAQIQTVLSDGTPATIAAAFYKPPKGHSKVVQVLIHGASYDRIYWDAAPGGEADYSYAREMAKRGWSVLAVDLLGSGESSKPSGDILGFEAQATALKSVIQLLRTSDNPSKEAFSRIVLVGHSNGAAIALFTQATLGGADGLVLTANKMTPTERPPMQPPQPDERDPSYLQFPAEMHRAMYDPENSDPAVVQYDVDNLNESIPRKLMTDLFEGLTSPDRTSMKVTVPILVQLGAKDPIAPASVAAEERKSYHPGADVTIQPIAHIGHAFNLHRTRGESWNRIDSWLTGKMGN